tara:strand:- start:79986 stop:80549 length:564 start_codon:yes stop_codon:yes gene_type:complete
MRRILPGLLASMLLAGCMSTTPLFNGENLQGWWTTGDAQWQAGNGQIVARGDGDGYIASDSSYGDFLLSLEFWVDATTNSGVYIRCRDRARIHPETCYEINIWDDHPQPDARTGSIVFKVMPPLAQVLTVGRWNRYEIVARGARIEARVNGVLTAVLEDADERAGFIALQHAETGTVKFRNIQLTPL